MQSLQKMVKLCETHAKENDLLFSTDSNPEKSKTVCIAFGETRDHLAPIILNGDKLPWKSKVKHIGTTIHEYSLLDQDIIEKRAAFIDVCMNLNQEFRFAKYETQLNIFSLYNCHFTGSSAWNFNSPELEKFFSSFNMNVKVVFDLPWPTHRWLCEALVPRHMKIMIYSRYIKFLNNICEKSDKLNVKSLLNVVAHDVRSQTGGNIRKILLDTGVKVVPGVTTQAAMAGVTAYEVQEDQQWRLPLLQSLLQVRDEQWEIRFDEDGEMEIDEDDVKDMITDVCTS